MVGVSWWVVIANGGRAPGGDMVGHAAAAEWLRTLPWWDWRGWSDWFYGGQAIGVNYPPLGHAWMRFTHPVHGQMAAVAIGLLVLLPWGALRLARAVGCSPRGQRAAVAGVLVMTALSGNMHWVLSGFHSNRTFFGSWPAMFATVLGLFAAAHPARCRRPVTAGVVLGVAGLFNATVIPGVAVVWVALLASSGASFGRALRWCATSASTALAVSAWWLVPFVAGWDRLVRWDAPLSLALGEVGLWQAAVLAVLGVAAAWASRLGKSPWRRLALAALAGLGATVLGDLFGYLRSERWLELSVLVAAIAAAGLAARGDPKAIPPVRPAWIVVASAALIVFAVVTLRLEVLPLAIWLMLKPQRVWAWGGGLAWAAILLLVPLWGQIRNPVPTDPEPITPMAAVAAEAGIHAAGLVYVDDLYNTAAGEVRQCGRGYPWEATVETGGRIRPLFGLYRETSVTAEFLTAENSLRRGEWTEPQATRPHWFEAWQAIGRPSLESPTAATALGARWFATCDADGNASVTEMPVSRAEGVEIAAHLSEDVWHREAVEWWVSLASDTRTDVNTVFSPIPVLAMGEDEDQAHPANQAASGLSLQAAQDRLTLSAQQPGWAWVRVPWDPYWRAERGAPVLKGGPGHIVVWAEPGTTEMRWDVPAAVDAAAAIASGAALMSAAGLSIINRRRGWDSDPDRPRPAVHAVNVFADTVDGWTYTAATKLRRNAPRGGR